MRSCCRRNAGIQVGLTTSGNEDITSPYLPPTSFPRDFPTFLFSIHVDSLQGVIFNMSFDINRTRSTEPPSPFRYASKGDKFDLHAKLSLSEDDGNSRQAIRQKSLSLAKAYRDVSKKAMAATEESASVTTPSPQQKRQSNNAFSSYQVSPPPYELQDAYNQIQEGEWLSDYVRDEDAERQRNAQLPAGRSRQTSGQLPRTHIGRALANEPSYSDAGFGNIFGEHKKQNDRNYAKDEQRLRRATGQHSPVFSKAQVGRDSSRTDNWRRRQETMTEIDGVSEDEGRLGPSGPSPNLPSGWGHRAGHRQEWERKVTPPSMPEQQDDKNSPNRRSELITSAFGKPKLASPRSPARGILPARSALEERPGTANLNNQGTRQGLGIKETGLGNDLISTGEAIPHSPITIYKNSSFTRPSPSKRDSKDLLRSLSRSEHQKADSIQTPEPVKSFERKIYDKTPRVTGAWIDTPVTQRATEKIDLPEDLTKDIVLPRTKKDSKDTSPAVESKEEAVPTTKEPKTVQDAQAEPLPSAQPPKTSRPQLPRPHLPKSALETVIEDASSGKDLDLGDDTIESLQAIMDGPSEVKSEDTEDDDDEAYRQTVFAHFEEAASKGPHDVNFESLNAKLTSLTKHINDVKKGLDGLERHVKQDVAISSQPNSPIKATTPTHFHADETCKACGPSHDGRVYTAVRLPRLLERSPRSQRLRPTKLLWAIVITLGWWMIECMMSDHFSHHEISEPCEGYCLQPNAPVYPWVTVTMMWRWSHLSAIWTPILTICIAFYRLVTQVLGFSDGYVDDMAELNNIMGEIRINGTPVAFPWLSSPTAANLELQTPPLPQVKEAPQVQQPVQRPDYAWPPPDAFTPRGGSDLPSMDEAMDDDEYV